MQALERAGVVRTLAEPTLTAISGETAKSWLAASSRSPVSQQDGQVTVDWKEFGVNVNFKPVVLTDGRISLNVAAEVSELDERGCRHPRPDHALRPQGAPRRDHARAAQRRHAGHGRPAL